MNDIHSNPTTDTIPQIGRRELARRENDGVSVVLFWHPRTDATTVSVDDLRTGDSFELDVAGEDALDAFYHPFAYALQSAEPLAAA
jgi:hypothetical protein